MDLTERLQRYIKIICDGNIRKILLTILRNTGIQCRQQKERWMDAIFGTWKTYRISCQGMEPIRIRTDSLLYTGFDHDISENLWSMYRDHRFDLLGSGWVRYGYGEVAGGICGYRYNDIEAKEKNIRKIPQGELRRVDYRNSCRIASLIDHDYTLIDWQRDLKSGYRWSAARWYRPQETAKKPGGDIKVPWELSRLQHLPRLAILSYVLPEKKKEIYREFRNQLLDFIAQNPVRMGVNHMCTMDVGIRTANIAMACSLFHGMGRKFDEKFERIVTDYLFQECEFIRTNLEWSYYLTSNHYFADIAGLLWGSAVLPKCRKRQKWLRFSRDQIQNEIRKQFHREGSNGEGSVAYHRLTGEMALYSAALIHELAAGNEIEDLEDDIYQILVNAGCFLKDLTRPDGMFTQIGDNDSGLFFRFSVTGELHHAEELKKKYSSLTAYSPQTQDEICLDENMNDGRTYISAVAGMFGQQDLMGVVQIYPFEYSLLRDLGNDDLKKWGHTRYSGRRFSGGISEKHLEYRKKFEIPCDGTGLSKDMSRMDYPGFGVYIFRSNRIYLCFNVTDNGQKGNAGHAHNDKLSFELFIDGKCIYEDPGTCVYTPFPELRDRFRSTQYHNTVWCGEEQNQYNGLFAMKDQTKCTVLELGRNMIEAQVEYRGIIHRRRVEICDNMIRITDMCNREFVQQFVQPPVARGYGKLER